MKVNCNVCMNNQNSECKYDFRFACTAGGSSVNDLCDVYFCQDYKEIEDDTELTGD